MNNQCKICKVETHRIFEDKILNKYTVSYYRCHHCDFIQTEEPYWLEESYNSAISNLDIGLINRNIKTVRVTKNVINFFFKKNEKFLDYGGGYGMFTRMMRDIGFNFFRQDIYCENLFAKNFDITNIKTNEKFELVTAFEVFEHLVNPSEEVRKMLELSDSILFSTEIHEKINLNFKNYWYFLPESGQHISLYSLDSLRIIALEYGLFFYTNGTSIHLLTKKKINRFLFFLCTRGKLASLISLLFYNKKSYLKEDFEKLKNIYDN